MNTKRMILLFCLLLGAGCSTLHDFALLNRSSADLQVAVSYSSPEPRELMMTDIDKMETGKPHWVALNAEQVTYDAEKRSYSVTLPPGKALLVWETSNYIDHENERFEISELTLTQGEDSQTLRDKAVQRAFLKGDGSDYTLAFTGSVTSSEPDSSTR